MGWEERSKTPLVSEKQGCRETERNQELRSSSLPMSPHPTPLTTKVPDSFCEKTSLQTHFDFWEAAQLHSLPSLFLGWELALRQGAGAGGLGVDSRVRGCQGPSRPQVFGSCDGVEDSTFRTPPGSRGRQESP